MMNPYGQSPYEQILRRTMARMKGLENMRGVATPQRPNTFNTRLRAAQRPSVRRSQNPYDIQFGSDYGYNNISTEVRF